jgi:hypothetical protein
VITFCYHSSRRLRCLLCVFVLQQTPNEKYHSAMASLRNDDVFMLLDYSSNFTTVEAEVEGHSP